MKIMTWVMSLSILLSMANVSFAEEVEYFFPKENPIFSLSLPHEWDVVSSMNGIPFIFMDASGKEKVNNGAPVNMKAAFFNPEGTHVFLLMVTGSPETWEKYEGEVQKIIDSIKPGN